MYALARMPCDEGALQNTISQLWPGPAGTLLWCWFRDHRPPPTHTLPP